MHSIRVRKNTQNKSYASERFHEYEYCYVSTFMEILCLCVASIISLYDFIFRFTIEYRKIEIK